MGAENKEAVASAFRNALNKHGFAFQYSSIGIADELFRQRTSHWVFQASEFPVDLTNRSKGTRIDFILRSTRSPVYLLFECKRANPALKNWCFARSPYVRYGRTDEFFFVESLKSAENGFFTAKGMRLRSLAQDQVYHLGLEVKGSESGDREGKGTAAIEEASGQICFGLNGLVETFNTHRVLEPGREAILIPVILTTASIWTTTADLRSADIMTGELSELPDVTERPCIFYQYHQSPGLKHSIGKPGSRPNEIASILDRDYIRTIPVVTAAGIREFLTDFNDDTSDILDTR